MALDSLQKIRSVEEDAEGTIRAARQQAAREVETAKKKQEEAYVSLEKRCRDDLKNALAGVEEEAKKLQEEQNSRVAEERQSLREAAGKRLPEAVQYIISGIFD